MYLFSHRERQREVMHSWKKYQLACVHKWKMMHSYLWLRGKYKELRLMGPCGTDSRLHLHCGREQSLWILVTRGVQCGVGWSGCARACMEPYLSLENPVCLARPCMGLPGSCSGPCTHAFKPSSITRHVAGGFVLLVWCIMQIIVTKYSIVTDLRLQSCTLIVEA